MQMESSLVVTPLSSKKERLMLASIRKEEHALTARSSQPISVLETSASTVMVRLFRNHTVRLLDIAKHVASDPHS
jgi:hypothetical protein